MNTSPSQEKVQLMALAGTKREILFELSILAMLNGNTPMLQLMKLYPWGIYLGTRN